MLIQVLYFLNTVPGAGTHHQTAHCTSEPSTAPQLLQAPTPRTLWRPQRLFQYFYFCMTVKSDYKVIE